MSVANNSFQHPENTKVVHLGVEDNLWSVLAILSLLGCCGRGSFAVLYSSPVPQNNFESHCFLKVILINMFPKIQCCQLSEVSNTWSCNGGSPNLLQNLKRHPGNA